MPLFTLISTALLLSHLPPRLTLCPFFCLSPSLFLHLALPFQGLFGRCTLCVSSGRRGEREHNHLQGKSRNPCPGATVGEGTAGCPQPRLSARWEQILKLRLYLLCITFGKKTCTDKFSYERPPLCDLAKDGCWNHTNWYAGKKHVGWLKNTRHEPDWPLLWLCSWPAKAFVDIIYYWRHQFSPSHQPLSVYSVWFVWQHH